MEYVAGQVVYSKSGHDKGGTFIVLSVEDEFLYLVDGKRRPLEKPKRKKCKHVQPTAYVCKDLQDKFLEEGYVLDADIVKGLKEYSDKEGSK